MYKFDSLVLVSNTAEFILTVSPLGEAYRKKMNLNGWCFRLALVGRSVRFTVSREKKMCKFPKKVLKKLADKPQEKQYIDYKEKCIATA